MREETAEGLCSLLFPTPDRCQALTDRSAEDAVVPRWGDGSVRGGCSGESQQLASCAPGDFCKLFQPRARTAVWMREVLWSLQGGVPGSGDCGPGHKRPDTPGLRGARLLTHPPQLSHLAESRLRGPRLLRPQKGDTSLLKGPSGR